MNIRDRIKELRRVPAADLRPNPKNWRTHPKVQQDAMRGLLAEIGFAGAALARELPDGTLMLIDGHLRAEINPTGTIPVLIIDVNEAEADKILATFDPVSAMAEADVGKLDSILREVETASEDVAKMLAELGAENGILSAEGQETELRQISTKPPPKMAWILIGIPLVRFGEIAAAVEAMSVIPDLVCETTVNDGR